MYDEIKNAIKNNAPIEDKLHMIIVVSNACLYTRRYALAKEFIKRIEKVSDVILYIVELAYDLNEKIPQNFEITDAQNPYHLQLRAKDVLWNKENLLNIGVKRLLPDDWKAVALVDCDIDFDNPHFAIDTLKVLNGCKDIIQLHSHVIDLGEDNNPINIFSSFGYQVIHGKKYSKNPLTLQVAKKQLAALHINSKEGKSKSRRKSIKKKSKSRRKSIRKKSKSRRKSIRKKSK